MVEEVVKQTYRYFYEDGLVEIAVGLVMLVVGIVLFFWQHMISSIIKSVVLVVILPTLVIGGMLFVRQFVRKAKGRVTYVRTGYVSFREGEPAGSRLFLLAAMIVLFTLLLFLPEIYSRMQFAIGYFSAVCLWYLGFRLGLRRFYGIGFVTLLIGVAATMQFANEAEGGGITIAGTGLLIFLSGLLTFIIYLQQNPEPVIEEE